MPIVQHNHLEQRSDFFRKELHFHSSPSLPSVGSSFVDGAVEDLFPRFLVKMPPRYFKTRPNFSLHVRKGCVKCTLNFCFLTDLNSSCQFLKTASMAIVRYI